MLDPIYFKRFVIVMTSFTKGIFLISIFLSPNIDAAKIGRVAFFEPDI